MSERQRLVDIPLGGRCRIVDFEGDDSLIQRLLEMGLTEDEEVEVLQFAPLGDPIEIRIRGYHLSLRRREASAVLVEPAQ